MLWQFKVGSGIVGAPMTYTGPDGKQYVAVYSGIGGDMGLLIAGDVAANLPYDVRERGTTLPDLARYTSWGGMLFVFSLWSAAVREGSVRSFESHGGNRTQTGGTGLERRLREKRLQNDSELLSFLKCLGVLPAPVASRSSLRKKVTAVSGR